MDTSSKPDRTREHTESTARAAVQLPEVDSDGYTFVGDPEPPVPPDPDYGYDSAWNIAELRSHVNAISKDVHSDNDVPTHSSQGALKDVSAEKESHEFILYVCPVGDLSAALEDFMDTSLKKFRRNKAHNVLPHVTLCDFFKCEDGQISHILHALEQCFLRWTAQAPKDVTLKLFVLQGYIGLFLDQDSASWFKELALQFATACTKDGVTVVPHRRQLHITMAHMYQPEHHSSLLELAHSMIDPSLSSRWELRLYSRDCRLASSEVFKIMYPYTPRKESELELVEGDYVFASSKQDPNVETGWFFGTSFLSGRFGLFPSNYVESARESDCWTLHRAWGIKNLEAVHGGGASPSAVASSNPITSSSYLQHGAEHLYTGLQHNRMNPDSLYDQVSSKTKHSLNYSSSKDVVEISSPPLTYPQGPRKLFVIRHAERVDVTFGKQWVKSSFNDNGQYIRLNLNMPKDLPERAGGPSEFLMDPPITQCGLYVAKLTGESMKDSGIKIHHVFSSPALRCVQTANAILEGMEEYSIKIKIEPALFEWLAWCRGDVPVFMSNDELSKFGLNVDQSYVSKVLMKDLKPNETHLEFYKRSFNITRLLMKSVGQHTGNIMIVGHAANLEACTRNLVGSNPRSPQELTNLVQKVPYCGVCVCQESESGKSSTWDFIDPPIPPLTHAPNIRFDWRCFIEPQVQN